MKHKSNDNEIEKSSPHIVMELIEYVPNATVSKTILKKSNGNVTVSSVDAGEKLAERILAFDNYIQIIDGSAQVRINDKKYTVHLGEGITIPAHTKHCFDANVQFKMISTIIKSGYEN